MNELVTRHFFSNNHSYLCLTGKPTWPKRGRWHIITIGNNHDFKRHNLFPIDYFVNEEQLWCAQGFLDSPIPTSLSEAMPPPALQGATLWLEKSLVR